MQSRLDRRPDLMQMARRLALEQDALLLAERLLAWTDEEIEKDLRSHPGVPPAEAIAARDLLLSWLRSEQETPQ
ncbi:MAG: hypothetical protein LC772_11045 [Chloroflexi bacterium]|nr:hypothetical protein [Chloroflexota bacterium]